VTICEDDACRLEDLYAWEDASGQPLPRAPFCLLQSLRAINTFILVATYSFLSRLITAQSHHNIVYMRESNLTAKTVRLLILALLILALLVSGGFSCSIRT
jgi:hypothetical protein